MSWEITPPKERAWTLILWKHYNNPMVAQWEPKIKRWIGYDAWGGRFERPAPECEWHPFPSRPRLNK